jgi:hypothetical protein
MGIAVIGGLIFSGGLTLYVIPAVYAYLPGMRHAFAPHAEPAPRGAEAFAATTLGAAGSTEH